jgi:hypothetical protein
MLKKIGSGLAKAATAVPELALNLVGFAGAGLIAYGAWLIYQPAGFITGGVLLLGGALLIARR